MCFVFDHTWNTKVHMNSNEIDASEICDMLNIESHMEMFESVSLACARNHTSHIFVNDFARKCGTLPMLSRAWAWM